MNKEFDISVENKLIVEQRDINVYCHSTGSSHIISCHSTVSHPLKEMESGDYLHISPVGGPGPMSNSCRIELPPWANFEFDSGSPLDGKITVTHSLRQTTLNIPPGSPTWHVKITRARDFTNVNSIGNITVRDNRTTKGN